MSRLRQIALIVDRRRPLVWSGCGRAIAPKSFYEDFPGTGRVWVAVDGPYNEHLVPNVGSLNLALAFVAALTLITGSGVLARAAGVAALIYGVPHLLYHATHLDPYDSDDKVALVFSLKASRSSPGSSRPPHRQTRTPQPRDARDRCLPVEQTRAIVSQVGLAGALPRCLTIWAGAGGPLWAEGWLSMRRPRR